jgi:hypothetical protein
MKKETYEKKLADLLGLTNLVEEKQAQKAAHNKVVAVPEEDINKAREAQGMLYFLQAPDLFQAKVCPHCGADFLVSRRFVKCCSYTCIAKELENQGIRWSRLKDDDTYEISEEWIKQIYEGNEPLWVRNLDVIAALLNNMRERDLLMR